MTDDDIKRITEEVGFVGYGEDMGEYHIPAPAFRGRLAWFARKVAKLERDACWAICLDAVRAVDCSASDAERIALKIAARDPGEDLE
jgi:hypothetical protein